MGFDIKRLWKLPFAAIGLGELFLLMHKIGQLGVLQPDPSTGRTFSVNARVSLSAPFQTYYLTAEQHKSVVWFGLGLAVFFICYLVSTFVTAGVPGYYRLLPIDGKNVDLSSRRSAFILTTAGALVGIALIIYSYSIC